MRNEMIGAVVRRAIEHPEFRKKLMEDPGAALSSHGFALESEEMQELERIRTDVGEDESTAEQKLTALAARYGAEVHPEV